MLQPLPEGVPIHGAGLLTETPMEAVFRTHDRIDRLGRMAITAGEESLHVAPRVGVAQFPSDASSAPDLIDAAMAASNRAQGEGPTFYAEDQRYAALLYTRVEAGLHEALAKEQFELWLQPKVSFRDGRASAAEALIRWRQPSGELMPPGEFIPVAATVVQPYVK